MASIAFIGLGNMGGPMALNLLRAGHTLHVFDLSASAVQTLVDAGAHAAASAAERAEAVQYFRAAAGAPSRAALRLERRNHLTRLDDEIAGEMGLEPFLVLERVMHLRIRHGARLEPTIKHL